MDRRLARVLAQVFALKESDIGRELRRDDVETWDSLKQMDLVLSLEREYGVVLEIRDIVRMTSVAAIEEVLRAKGVDLGG